MMCDGVVDVMSSHVVVALPCLGGWCIVVARSRRYPSSSVVPIAAAVMAISAELASLDRQLEPPELEVSGGRGIAIFLVSGVGPPSAGGHRYGPMPIRPHPIIIGRALMVMTAHDAQHPPPGKFGSG